MRFETRVMVLNEDWEDCRVIWDANIIQNDDRFKLEPDIRHIYYIENGEKKEWDKKIDITTYYLDIGYPILPQTITVYDNMVDIDFGS